MSIRHTLLFLSSIIAVAVIGAPSALAHDGYDNQQSESDNHSMEAHPDNDRHGHGHGHHHGHNNTCDDHSGHGHHSDCHEQPPVIVVSPVPSTQTNTTTTTTTNNFFTMPQSNAPNTGSATPAKNKFKHTKKHKHLLLMELTCKSGKKVMVAVGMKPTLTSESSPKMQAQYRRWLKQLRQRGRTTCAAANAAAKKTKR